MTIESFLETLPHGTDGVIAEVLVIDTDSSDGTPKPTSSATLLDLANAYKQHPEPDVVLSSWWMDGAAFRLLAASPRSFAVCRCPTRVRRLCSHGQK